MNTVKATDTTACLPTLMCGRDAILFYVVTWVTFIVISSVQLMVVSDSKIAMCCKLRCQF